jgi:hypothetical protein
VFENKLLRRIFGRIRGITGVWRKLTNNIKVKSNKYENSVLVAQLKNLI